MGGGAGHTHKEHAPATRTSGGGGRLWKPGMLSFVASETTFDCAPPVNATIVIAPPLATSGEEDDDPQREPARRVANELGARAEFPDPAEGTPPA